MSTGPKNDPQPAPAPTEFEDKSYDFPNPTAPRLFYMIASTPRSGGTYLSQRLWRTGLMGAPHEYFGFPSTMLRTVARLNPRTLDDYLAKLTAARTSANGVFGFKAHYDHLQFMLLAGIIARMGRMAVIAIERRDRLAQAVSHARALQTVQWTSLNEAAARQPKYDPKLIRWCLDHLAAQRRGWRNFFVQHKLTPYRVDYDEFIAAPDDTVRRLLDQTGFPRQPVSPVSLPETRRQSDAINADWIERFNREKQPN